MAAKYPAILTSLTEMINGMAPGGKIPNEHELAELYGASRMTVRRALQVLIDEGRLRGVRGSGTFVTERALKKTITIASFTESMQAVGLTPSTTVLGAAIAPATAEECGSMDLADGAMVYRIERLRLGDGVPMGIERTVWSAERFPGLLGHDLTRSLYGTLAAEYDCVVQRSRSLVSAIALNTKDAKLLETPRAAPGLRIRSANVDTDGSVIERGLSVYRADRYEVEFSHHRD
ncbi:MAG: GntR family transcriptional regulator [Propionibacteriaceae bacterium]